MKASLLNPSNKTGRDMVAQPKFKLDEFPCNLNWEGFLNRLVIKKNL